MSNSPEAPTFATWNRRRLRGRPRSARTALAAAAALAAIAALAGCGGAARSPGAVTPPIAHGFTPGPPPGKPAAPDPHKLGLAYLDKLHARLAPAWHSFVTDARMRLPPSHPLNNGRLAVAIALSIRPDGTLARSAIVSSSRNGDFDDAAMEIVRDAAPFARPPAKLCSDDDLVHVKWLFARDRRSAGVATAEVTVIQWPPARAVPKMLSDGDIGAAAARIARAAEKLPAGAAAAGRAAPLLALFRDLVTAEVRRGLGADSPDAQKLAVRAAAAGKLAEVETALRALAQRPVDADIVRAALGALGAVGDPSAKPFLAAIVRGRRPAGLNEVAAAAAALAALGGRKQVVKVALARLDVATGGARAAALAAMARVPVPAATPKLASLLAHRGPRAIRLAAAAALGAAAATDRAALRPLYRALGASDAMVRAAAARAIAAAAASGLRSRGAYWKLTGLIAKDRDERVRAAAVTGAARLEPRKFSVDFRSLLRHEHSRMVLAALATALAHVPGKAARSRLTELAGKGRAAPVRRAAARALAARGDTAARRLAAGLVDDRDPEVRIAAVSALSDPHAIAPYLASEPAAVRAAALAALIRAGGRAAALATAAQLIAQARSDVAALRMCVAWLGTGRRR